MTFVWCRDLSIVDQVADFFVRNISPEYISHSEIQTGRAIDPHHWADDLLDVIRREIREAVEQLSDPGVPGRQLALALQDQTFVACAFVTFSGDTRSSYAMLDDIVVALPGMGGQFLRWIEGECRRYRIQRLFLESGQANLRAHRFFRRHGFEQTSIVMMKELL